MSTTADFLYSLTLDGGWPDSGEVDAPVGWFAAVDIAADDVSQLTSDHPEAIQELEGQPMPQGNFIVRQDSDGHRSHEQFDTRELMQQRFSELEQQYAQWGTE